MMEMSRRSETARRPSVRRTCGLALSGWPCDRGPGGAGPVYEHQPDEHEADIGMESDLPMQ